MDYFDLQELQKRYPEAYAALPSSYQNDSCLTFFVDVNGNLIAQHDLGEEFMFTKGENKWIRIA